MQGISLGGRRCLAGGFDGFAESQAIGQASQSIMAGKAHDAAVITITRARRHEYAKQREDGEQRGTHDIGVAIVPDDGILA